MGLIYTWAQRTARPVGFAAGPKDRQGDCRIREGQGVREVAPHLHLQLSHVTHADAGVPAGADLPVTALACISTIDAIMSNRPSSVVEHETKKPNPRTSSAHHTAAVVVSV
eukprot:scaffold22527_cov34-Prasinocladus_malaysianus.AAC.1